MKPRQKRQARHPAEAVVGPLLVVDVETCIGDRLQFRHRFKEMRVERFGEIGAIEEALDIRVLIRLARCM